MPCIVGIYQQALFTTSPTFHIWNTVLEGRLLTPASSIHWGPNQRLQVISWKSFPPKADPGGSLDKIAQGISRFQWIPGRLSWRVNTLQIQNCCANLSSFSILAECMKLCNKPICDSPTRTVLGAQPLCHRRWRHLKSRVKVDDDDLSWWLVWRWYHCLSLSIIVLRIVYDLEKLPTTPRSQIHQLNPGREDSRKTKVTDMKWLAPSPSFP